MLHIIQLYHLFKGKEPKIEIWKLIYSQEVEGKRIKGINLWEFSFRKKCRWENTTAITAIRNSRILQWLGGVIFKVFNIKEPKLFDPQLFNDPDSFGKGVCNHFVRTGYCQYGDSCKYYHPKQNSQTVNQTGIPPGENSRGGFHTSGQPFGSASFPVGDVFREKAGASLGNLPPSLRPPPEGGYPSLPFVDWG